MIPKFRGFRTKTEEWVEGNLIYREEPYQHDIVTPIGNSSTISYAVERDSIGQWTGLKDKNDKEIYEGDILTLKYPRDRRYTVTAKVIRGTQISAMVLKFEDGFTTEEIPLYKISAEHNLEVIGNIYENPELLEVAE